MSKQLGRRAVLAGVSLTVREGEVMAVMGPNGAGKSTLLRILLTTVLPDGGEVEVCGVDAVARPDEVRRRVGFVIGDNRSWYWRLSGRANLEFFAILAGLRPAEARRRAAELLASVDIGDAGHRRVGEYSAGMRLRLSIARAQLMRPPVLLLDEPTQNLDPAGRVWFQRLVRDLATKDRAAVLLVTHDVHEAEGAADRAVVLAAGRVHARFDDGVRAAELGEILEAQT